MQLIEDPRRKDWPALLARPTQDFSQIVKIVKPIVDKVRRTGDRALLHYAAEYDHVQLQQVKVTEAEVAAAEGQVSDELKRAIALAQKNIEAFHTKQRTPELVVETMPGVVCRRRSVPIEKVGLYIPGGTAPLFSTVLMLAVPARLAGCSEIVLCTPPGKDGTVHPAILYTAAQVGVTTIIKAGGAQAVAAMAFGTESVPQVYKLFGPGNQFVTAAKMLAIEEGVAIDMPAGPSELAVYADETANPDFVAADLLSQAEHGVDSQVVLVSKEKATIKAIMKAINGQVKALPRKHIAEKALENSRAFLVDKKKKAIALINEYGPEHLILAVDNAREVADQIVNAGSVFIGHYTPESVGDYASGTNHTLPTNGAAKAFSGVSLDSFMKKITFQELTPEGIQGLGPAVEQMAEAEQLMAHKNAVTLRLNQLSHV